MRLVDLHCDWLWQYAAETTLFEPSVYAEIPARLPALDGYLLGASAAILFCSRKPADWAARADRWGSLGDLVARYEAEFAGRLLIGPEDLTRMDAEPADGLCWGMLGIGGLDFMVRESADIERLASAFERGVRVFQLVDGPNTVLGGSAVPGDDRNLTDLGLAVLNTLLDIAPPSEQTGPRPVVDVAGMNAPTLSQVLDWFEQEPIRSKRLVVLSSHGLLDALAPRGTEPIATRSATENLLRFRNLGGLIGISPGPPAGISPEALRELIEAIASIPFLGRAGYEGIGIGTNFFRMAALLPELSNVERLTDWLTRTFDAECGQNLAERNGRLMLARAAGSTIASRL
jgi:membrane dipeptidase